MTDPEVMPQLRGLKSVQHVSPTQQVREQLLSAIERGDFPGGSMLPSERVLCETFGVSRVSVREAIAGLEAMGLIAVKHGRGAFVRSGVASRYAGPFAKFLQLHRDELVELLKVRGALDKLAAEEAALHGTERGLVRVKEACQRFSEEAEKDVADLRRLAELDTVFHISIAEAAVGELLPKLVRELNGLLDESRRMMFGLRGQATRSVRQHQAIADAILAGDAPKARRASSLHVAGVRLRIEKLSDREEETS